MLSDTENWNIVYQSLTNNRTAAAYECFFNQYNTIFEHCFPEKVLKIGHKITPRHDWMTLGLMKSCCKKKLYKKYIQTRTILDKNRCMIYKKN